MNISNIFAGYGWSEIKELSKSLLKDGFAPLFKALDATTTDSMTDLSQLTGGRAITVENIDTTLKSTVAEERQLRWWTLLKHNKIYAVLDQWMKLSGHGEAGGRHSAGVFTSESGFPKEKDVELARQVDTTKFMRDLRHITHVMANVNAYADPNQIIDRAGAMTVLNASELCTVFGNSEVIPYEFDGFIKKITDAEDDGYDVVYDCRKTGSASGSLGGSIDEGVLETVARKINEGLGAATHMIAPAILQEDFDKILPVSRRVNVVGAALAKDLKDLMGGLPMVGFMSPFAYNGWGEGTVPHFKFVPHIDKYFPSGESAKNMAPSSAREVNSGDAPDAPTGVTVELEADSGTEFGAGDLGDYYYKVTSLNADGESAATAGDVAATVTSGRKVKLTIAANDSSITGFAVYRSALNASDGSDCRLIGEFAVDNATGNTVVYDSNAYLPGTSTAIVISNAPETDALSYQQLLPFVRIPLPFSTQGIVGYPYLYLLYHYLRMQKMENKQTGFGYHMLIKNIGYSKTTF